MAGTCDIYSIVNPTGGPLDIYYTDCNSGTTLTTVSADKLIYRCILEITNVADGLVITNLGPCTDCRCRTLQNTGESNSKFYYVDCDNNFQSSPTVSVGTYIQVCAKVLSFDDGVSWNVSDGDTCIENKCPCRCYYTIAENIDKVLRYFDCDSNAQATLVPANSGLLKNCNTFIMPGLSSPTITYNSGSLCVDSNCPTFYCQCYSVTNNGLEVAAGVTYLNCDNQIVSQVIAPTETFTFCALNIQYMDPRGSTTPDFPANFTVTNSGDCFNGQCTSSLSIEDQLLYDILTKYGPCPSICDGSTPVGGPAGTSIIDIKTGGIIGSTN